MQKTGFISNAQIHTEIKVRRLGIALELRGPT